MDWGRSLEFVLAAALIVGVPTAVLSVSGATVPSCSVSTIWEPMIELYGWQT